MNGAGHIADMIARMKFNKEQRGRRKERSKKFRDATLHDVHQHDSLSNLVKRKMSAKEKIKLRTSLQKENRQKKLEGLLVILIIACIMLFLLYNFLFLRN